MESQEERIYRVEAEREKRIKVAVETLTDAINDLGVSPRKIGEQFQSVHAYHLNQLALGVLYAVSWREGDGRINPVILKTALEVWGSPRPK